MTRHFILAQSEITARALGAWLELMGEGSFDDGGSQFEIVSNCRNPSKTFERIAGVLQAGMNSNPRGFKVLVDSIRPQSLNPLGKSGWDPLIAMLILAFPRIRWHFGVCQWPGPATHLASFHSLSALFTADHDPLFDGSGLREFVRENMRGDPNFPVEYLAGRKDWAAALDDEASYAYFNAYTAYKWGFRSFVVNRNHLAKWLFDDKESSCHLTFEDIFLNYPDRDRNDHYSELSNYGPYNRVNGLPGLESAAYRVFVSSSQTRTGDTSKRLRNREYIQYATPSPPAKVHSIEIHKPLAGMYDLWERSRLKDKLLYGKAPGFIWPPIPTPMPEDEKTGHGAPGRLLQISEILIYRAENIMNDGVISVEQAVHGAVLATDALELLGSKTPTTSIEALCLKHAFELLAECQFSGVEYHIRIRDRLTDISQEVEVISGWFNPAEKKIAAWNAEMHIINRLVGILRDNNQFDEEQICANRARHLHYTLWMGSTKIWHWKLRWGYIFWPVLRYTEFLLGSFMRFSFALLVWSFLLFGLFATVEPFRRPLSECTGPATPIEYISSWLSLAATALFGAEPAISYNPIWVVTAQFASIVGIAHLGIFISHLYTVVSRR